MSFVFISHANEDKARIRPIVDALLAAGHKVFLDNPDRAGYTPDVEGLYRLYYDQPWEAQLHEALRKSACVLVCWSRRAADPAVWQGHGRRVWMDEVGYARTAQKAVHCVVDDVPPSALPGTNSNDNLCQLDTDLMDDRWRAALGQLLEDVERVTERSRRSGIASRGARSDIDLPLLANRSAQEDAFYSAVSAAAGTGGVYPIALKGPCNELPEAFIERFERTSMSLRTDGEAWFREKIDWPRDARTSDGFARQYRAQLWRKLGLKLAPGEPQTPEAQDRRIADHLAQRDLTAILHNIDPKHWRRREEPELIRAWMSYWASLAAPGARLKVVPILIVPFPSAAPGWRECPGGRTGGRVGVKTIWKSVRKLTETRAALPGGMQLTLPPVLKPIEEEHARAWLADDLSGLETQYRTRIQTEIDALYARGRAKRHGVAHQDFHDRLKGLCAEARRMASA